MLQFTLAILTIFAIFAPEKSSDLLLAANHCQQSCHGLMGSQHRVGTMATKHCKQARFALSRLVPIAVGAEANSTMVESQHHGCMRTNTVSARPWQKAPMHNAPIALPCFHAPMQNGIQAKPLKMQPRTLCTLQHKAPWQ